MAVDSNNRYVLRLLESREVMCYVEVYGRRLEQFLSSINTFPQVRTTAGTQPDIQVLRLYEFREVMLKFMAVDSNRRLCTEIIRVP
jgi:hypothetical protein